MDGYGHPPLQGSVWQRRCIIPNALRTTKNMNWKKCIRIGIFVVIGVPVLLFVLLNACFPLPARRLHPPPSALVLDRNGQGLRAFLATDGMWRMPEPELSRVSPGLTQAALAVEDRWFHYHWGINPVSLAGAAYDNLRAGKVVRGGSTITMQLARLMEPKARTLPNKCVEMFRALQLELTYSKSEILTFYFNMLPYGGNIVGSAAAARLYFNKPQQAMSLGEAALLASIPNAPEHLRPDRFPKRARTARNKVLALLLARRQIAQSQWHEARQEPIPTRRHPLPFKAPHLARLLAKKQTRKDGRIYTTIDAHIQETAVRILQQAVEAQYRTGSPEHVNASTGAVVVMDTQHREVLALVGSHDFFDSTALGQVNGALAPRSPGSALKPFVYALAIERGVITPETLLFDVPVSYRGYRPVNYDGTYSGYVSAREALARSLNVPAVNLAAQLDTSLEGFLKQAGISTLSDARRYGLSMVLGGCEVNLLELTTLYAGLANMGEFAPYQLRFSGHTGLRLGTGMNAHPTEQSGPSLLRPETCYIVLEMLTTLERPDFPKASFDRTVNLPKIAWKTGTSFGHRDAWSLGTSPELTIGVWLGNFSGKGAPNLSGAEAATPILFALFNALTAEKTHRWFPQPEGGLRERQVCALSGQPPSAQCPAQKTDVYMPGVSPVNVCSLHQQVWVDKATGYSVCPQCASPKNEKPGNYEERVLTEWPAEAATWLAENGFAVPVFPPHNPRCTAPRPGDAPVILSPEEDTVYTLRTGVPREYQKIRLAASISNRTQELFWFLDGELVSTAPTFFLMPVVGQHTVTCVDGDGRATSRHLVIKTW